MSSSLVTCQAVADVRMVFSAPSRVSGRPFRVPAVPEEKTTVNTSAGSRGISLKSRRMSRTGRTLRSAASGGSGPGTVVVIRRADSRYFLMILRASAAVARSLVGRQTEMHSRPSRARSASTHS
jgi:hypothetical protein